MPTRSKSYLTTSAKPKTLVMQPRTEKHEGYAMSWWKMYSYQLRATTPCNHCGKITKPKDSAVDHIIPVRFGGSFDDKRNHQVLCSQCHNKKTAKEKTRPTVEAELNEHGKLIPKQKI